MSKTHKAELTASEISNLWTSYQNDTMAKCVLSHFIATCDDESTSLILKNALSLSEMHIQKVTDILRNEGYPIPVGFTDNDVKMDAPRLFSNKLYLLYVLNMGKFGLSSYGYALAIVSREDIIQFYSECLAETTKLHNNAKKLTIEKGILIRPPVIPRYDKVDFVKKQNFLAGYIGNRRPLLACEIANFHYNAERNALGGAVIMGFSQVAKDKNVRKYFERGRDISHKHLEIFNSILGEDYLSSVINLGQEVSNSKISPFSDKLMMFHIASLTASGIGQYGISMSTSPRHDLGVLYERLIGEIIHYSDDGANIMIEHGWMEQPPKVPNRKELAKE